MKSLTAFAALSLVMGLPAAAMAQNVGVTANGDIVLTSEQRMAYDAWPMERRATYDAWPDGVQTYYWTLPADRQTYYWTLDDAERVRIYEMPMNDRNAYWMERVANAATPNANASARAMTTPSRTTATNNSGMVQAVPAARSGEYPPCRGAVQDGCVNPREAGLNYGNRPLDHWPGQPASERAARTPGRN